MTSEGPKGPSRRLFLQVVAAVPAAAVLPGGCGDNAGYGFLTAGEASALRAIANAIFPADDRGPGAGDLGAVGYIDQLLSAFDHDPPRLLAAGPYSGRTAFPAADGSASRDRPDDGFLTFLPLTRIQEHGWRLRLFGSAGVPGGGPNDAVLGPIVGLRDLIRDGLAEAIAAADGQEAALYDLLPADARTQLEQLVLESLFALPEYGGNRDGGGWRAIYFEGDSMPLGYTFVDEAGQIADRPERPVIGPEPGDDPDPMDDEVIRLFGAAVVFLGGKQFY